TASGTSVDPVALFTGTSIADIDLSTTAALTSTVFGAGSITVSFTDAYVTGDVLFVNAVLPAGVTVSGGTANALTITLGTATTVAEVNSVLAAISYKSTSDNPTVNDTDNTRNYQIVVNDGNNRQGAATPNAGGAAALDSNIISGILTITRTNDAPVVDLNGITAGTDNAVTWTENSNAAHTAVAINPSATVADTDNTNMTQLVMQVGGVLDGNNEVLNIGGGNFLLNTTVSNVAVGGFLVSYNSGTGTFTILPTPTTVALASSFQTLIQGITYINNTDNVTVGNRTVTFNITDAGFDNSTAVGGELGSNIPTTTINVVRANDQPVITNLNAISYFENAINTAAAIIDGSITLTDIDSPNYNGGTLTVSGLIAAQDTVSLPTGAASVTGNIQINGGNVEYYDGSAWVVIGTQSGGVGANFVVSFNASATPAIVQRVIENLTFANSSNNPTLSRTLNLALNDGGTGTVQNATVGITIKLDNDAPVMTAATLGGTYTEQNVTPLQFISGAISVSDPDSPANFYINTAAVAGSLTVALDGYQTGDTLSVVHQGNGAGQIGVVGNTLSYGGTAIATTSGGNGAPLVITFTSATATPTAVQALLAQLAFSNTTNEDPTVNNTDPSRVFTVTLNDGGNTKDTTSSTTALTATLTGTINLTAVNDKPVITPAGTPAAYTENAVATVVDNALTVADVDDTQINGGTISITGNFLAGDVLAVTNIGNITGNYVPATGVLTLSGLDSIANYQAVLRSLTYLNSTDDPTDNTTKTTRTLTYSLTDANSDAVGAATSIAATKTINVTPLQDAPVLTGGGATLTYTEQTAAAVIDATVTVSSDADDTQMSGATITLSAGYTAGDILNFTAQNGITVVSNSGGVLVLTGNATLANYTTALRSISFNSTSDTPTIISASRTVTWQVRDANSDATGVASSNTVTSTINILAINDTPVLTALGNTVNFTEVGTAVVLNNAVTVADVDLSPLSGGAGNYNGTTLTLMRNGGANAADVFSSTGTLAALTQGGNVTVGGTTIGTVTSNSAGTLVLTFNANATTALVNSALQQIAYRNTSTTPQASVQIDWLFNDQNPNITGGGILGTGQDQGGGGVLSASGSTTITIDRLPTANADTNNIAENALNVTGNVMTGATTTDDQGDPAATVTGVALGTQASTSGSVNTAITGSYGSLTLDSTGAYTYTLDNTNPLVNKLLTGQTLTETYSYTITDADGDTSTTTLIITINGVTDGAPTVVPVDGNGAATGEATVFEQGLVTIPDTSETTTGTLTVTAPDGMASVTIGGTTFTVAQLAAFSVGSPSAAINTGEGTLKVTGFTIGTGAASAPTAGTLSYTYTLNATQAHTGGAAVTESVDTIALVVTDATTAANTSTGTLTVRIVDDTPTANADTNSITENAATTTGNVFSGSGGDVADRLGADVTATPVTGVAAGTQASTSGNVGSAVAGSYGSLTLNATGGYTYTLDNSNAAVNALRTGQTLTDTYSYTITDADGDTSTTTLTVTINGATDGAPVITPVDGNGAATGQAEVYEKGLVTVADTSETTTGTLTISAPDGMASVTIGGTTFTVAQLATFNVGSPSAGINTGEGTLIVTGFTVTTGTASAPTAGTLSYSYTLNATQAHTGGAAVTESVDSIALIVTDATTAANTSTGTLTVRIVDDTPTANADVNSIAEDTATKSGNVFSGSSPDVADRLGADVTATPVTGIAAGTQATTSGNVGSAVAGSYGSLTLNADGSYTYTLDNTNPLVNKLLTGDTLLDTYSYTITDSDGDTSTTTLKITINGTTDNIPSIVPDDINTNAITGHISVRESGLTSGADTSETTTGTLQLSALDGLASINVGGTAVTLAQLNTLGATPMTIVTPKGTITLTGYNSTANVGGVSTAGTLTYTYTLTQVQNTPAATENTNNIVLSITNAGGNTVTDTLIVQIVDDTPTANADINSVNEGNTTAATTTSGNVFSGSATDIADRIGADVNATPVTGVALGVQLNTSGNINSPVTGNYGSLTLNATGGYTYTLNNTNPAVNALLTGETLLETYSYTITDADGDTSTTTLTITIRGITDSTPEITPINGNNPTTTNSAATVFEKGLVTPSDGSQMTTGTVSVTAPDGMASVTIGGTVFTIAQLATFSVGSPSASINTGEGTLVVTGFNIVAGPNPSPTAGTLSYRYTLNAAQPHTGGIAVTESTDRITLIVTDNSSKANTATNTLIVRIVDDTPTGKADTNSVIEGTTTAATTTQGNVFGAIGASAGDVADRIGADATATPVTGVSFAGSVKTVGSAFNSAYGSLTLNANGSYIYTLDNTNATVNALGLGQTLSETFNYTITDADGDTSTTTLTITINGRNDAPIAVNDIQTGITGQPVIINVLGNDRDPENNINPATVKIVGTVNAGDSLEVAGEGIWSVNRLTGAITFTPFAGFTADPTPISYTVTDRTGLTSNPATVTVDYPQTPPLAVDNVVTAVTGKPITITVLDNDSD
ncbi:MAG: VCBS domain-containing protein, partial [Methylococcales bacterium]|nr:VCBS domain-containing protein [Methylococcales bacterium]